FFRSHRYTSVTLFVFCFFFFFQAEDGIRDRTVTGVQTCALPISLMNIDSRSSYSVGHHFPLARSGERAADTLTRITGYRRFPRRSEERRVGKECRSRWGRGH